MINNMKNGTYRKTINNSLPRLINSIKVEDGIVIEQWQWYASANGHINQDESLVGQHIDTLDLSGYREQQEWL